MQYGFGVDIGGTTIKIGLFSVDGDLMEKWEIPTNKTDNGKYILIMYGAVENHAFSKLKDDITDAYNIDKTHIDENKIERTDKKEEAAKTEKEKMPQTNMGAMVAILILALGGVAAYYYFKIYKPKKEEEEDFEEEGLEISDGLESINEDEFEDREEENE